MAKCAVVNGAPPSGDQEAQQQQQQQQQQQKQQQKQQQQQQKPGTAGAAGQLLAAAARRLHSARLPRRLALWLAQLRVWVWFLIEELLEEFQPWLKWIIFDAALTLVVGHLVKRVEALRPLFEAVGWA